MWARFFEKGYYEKHRQFLIDFYRKKRDLMCSALSCIPGLSFSVPTAVLLSGSACLNIQMTGRLPRRQSGQDCFSCREIPFCRGQPWRVLYPGSYSSVTDEEIAEGCRRMAEVLNSCRSNKIVYQYSYWYTYQNHYGTLLLTVLVIKYKIIGRAIRKCSIFTFIGNQEEN